jgi:phosphoribosylformylglycinamidine synthase
VENESGRFESRFVMVRVEPSPCILLKGMEGAVLGVWSAHGEGRVAFDGLQVNLAVLRTSPAFGNPAGVAFGQLEEAVVQSGLAPIRYVDPGSQESTERYPYNPNGSPHGIAALCSPDGRHMAMMPHPERSFLNWQVWLRADGTARLATSTSLNIPLALV